ncbi:MAG: glycosyltransferase, partial [Spirochaetales bacterium]|nr:glycosyltransferase [Spirochaetales bacterium]
EKILQNLDAQRRGKQVILHVMDAFSLLSETFLYNLIQGLQSQSHQLHLVLTHAHVNSKSRSFPHVIVAPPAYLHRYQHPFLPSDERKAKDYIPWIRRIAPDLVHAHFGWAGIPLYSAVMKKVFPQIPLVVSLHGSDVTSHFRHRKRYRRIFLETQFHAPLRMVVQSQFLHGILSSAGYPHDKLDFVYNSYAPGLENEGTSPCYVSSETFKILHVGRLVPCKGQEYLIRAFAQFLQHHENSLLTLVGEGMEESKLKDLVFELGIPQKVHFLGGLEQSEVFEQMRNHHLYVQPSIRHEKTGQEESFGVAVLEAMMCGLPVIASRIGGLVELVEEDGVHQLVPEKDASALVQAMVKAHHHAQSFVSSPIQRTQLMARYSPEAQLQAMLRVYQKLLSFLD